MSSRSLPARPDLAQLKIQANELRRSHRAGSRSAAARIVAHHPRRRGQPLDAVLDEPLKVADAQLVVAREYGFADWAELKRSVELASELARFEPHPRFDDAVAAIDAGDLDRLRALIASEPELIDARTNLDPKYGYFSGATLLHHVAGNPDRGRLTGELGPPPANIVEIARLLLDAGADVNASTLGRDGCTTMGLLETSKQASDAGVSGPLIDLLLEYGATLDLNRPGALDAALSNHAPRAAERMIELGAKPDLLAAAALGRLDLVRACFDDQGRLRSRPRRRGKAMNGRDAIGLALLFAYVAGQAEAVDFLLEKDGNWDVTGVNNGAALHRAAWDGDLAMVQRLVARGAALKNRDNPFHATPLSWARYNNQEEVFVWLRTHNEIDLHDAVCFDLRDQVEARLRDNPASVNDRLDQWDIPNSAPLHWAARLAGDGALATLLLERGADPNIVAGNGLTPLDLARAAQADAVAAILEQHGGKRAADL